MNKVIKLFEDGCEALKKEFAKKYDFADNDCFWVGGNIGDICSFGDFYFSTEDMKVALSKNVSWDDLLEWYWYRTDAIGYGLNAPNLSSWVRGCPRADKETMELLEKLQKSRILKYHTLSD